MSLEMQNENELVMESMVPTGKVVSEKKVSKTLTMNEKRAMYGILSFLVIVNRDGLLDDAKTQELMEHLPIFGTVAEKKLYLSQEMFDMKQIETDILKPMVLEHNQRKKEEKKKGKVSEKKGGEVKEKKKRVYKKKEEVKEGEEEEVKEKKKRVYKKKEEAKEEVKEEGEVEEEGEEVEVKTEVKEKKKRVYKKKEEVKEEGKEGEEVKEKKRGRKAKEQIVECKMDVNVNEGNSQEDQLAALVNQLTDSNFELANPGDIDVDDLDNLLSDMHEEEEEIKKLPETPRLLEPEPVPVPVPVQVTKEKVQKKKTSKKNK